MKDDCKYKHQREGWRYGVDMMLCKCVNNTKLTRSMRDEDFIRDMELQWHDTQIISFRQLAWLKSIYQDIKLQALHGKL